MGFGGYSFRTCVGNLARPNENVYNIIHRILYEFISLDIRFSIEGVLDKDRALPFGPFLSIGGTGVYVGSFYYPDFFYLLMLQ